jgi:hypothetical protein
LSSLAGSPPQQRIDALARAFRIIEAVQVFQRDVIGEDLVEVAEEITESAGR